MRQGFKSHQKTFGGDRNVHCLSCVDGFMIIYICQHISNYILNTGSVFLYMSVFQKAVFF